MLLSKLLLSTIGWFFEGSHVPKEFCVNLTHQLIPWAKLYGILLMPRLPDHQNFMTELFFSEATVRETIQIPSFVILFWKSPSNTLNFTRKISLWTMNSNIWLSELRNPVQIISWPIFAQWYYQRDAMSGQFYHVSEEILVGLTWHWPNLVNV